MTTEVWYCVVVDGMRLEVRELHGHVTIEPDWLVSFGLRACIA